MSSGPRRIDAAELQRCARLNALLEVREMVDSHVGIGKPRWEQGYNWMKQVVLQDLDAMIAKEQR